MRCGLALSIDKDKNGLEQADGTFKQGDAGERARIASHRVQQLLDEQPVGRFQILVLLMCMFIVTLDGLDTVMVGFIAPALSSAWAIPREALRPVMSGGLLGLAFGALFRGRSRTASAARR
jgi:hypothetical protein